MFSTHAFQVGRLELTVDQAAADAFSAAQKAKRDAAKAAKEVEA